MTLPTLSQAYSFSVNNVCATGGGATLEAKLFINQIKDVLLALGWSVWGSSRGDVVGEFGNGNGVDWWSEGVGPSLIYAGRAWIVLTEPVTGVQILFHFSDSSYAYTGTVRVSLGGNFGTAEGGADGGYNFPPTAPDAVTFGPSGWCLSTPATYIVHGMRSSDGRVTRVITCNSGNVGIVFLFDDVVGGIPQIARPIAGVRFSGGPIYAAFNDVDTMKGTISGAAVTLYISSEGQISSMLGEQMTYADDDTGEWPMAGMGLFCPTGGHRGRKGRIQDLWWGSTLPAIGTLYPASASAEFVQFGHMIFPWNGAIPQVS